MYAAGSDPPAPPPSAAVIVLTSLPPAKIDTTVVSLLTNGISCSMKVPTMVRP
jgi:hypothetical protein